jgi:hypothetical protein
VAALDREGDVVEGEDAGEAFGDGFEFKHHRDLGFWNCRSGSRIWDLGLTAEYAEYAEWRNGRNVEKFYGFV